MDYVRWDKKCGIVDAKTGKILLQLAIVSCSKKYREMAGKELVNKLNSVVRGSALKVSND